MPGNRIYISKASPVIFYRVDPVVDPKYNTVPWDQDWFSKSIKSWEDEVEYFQKWQQTDSTKIQIKAAYEPIKLQIIDCEQRVYDTIEFAKMPTAIIGQPTSVYEATIQWAEYEEGIYYILLVGGFGELTQYMISEPQEIKLFHEDTMLVEYKHSFNKENVVFDTGIEMCFRVEASVVEYEPGSEDVLFIDQPHNVVLLDSVVFDSAKLSVGGSYGVPYWVARLMNYIFSFDNVKLDGTQYVKNQGAKWEGNSIPDYPLAGWKLEISPANNQDSAMFDDTFDDQISVVYNIKTSLFGNIPPGDGSMQIIENS